MSKFKSELNAKEKRELFDPAGSIAIKHPAGIRMLVSLKIADFHICEVIPHEHHLAIRLGCGAVLSVYRSGKVMIQGRLHGSGAGETKEMLVKILPAQTIWQIRLDR